MIAFFAQISDPRFGSTYMTLFNTVRSVGFLISNMLLLEMVDILTFNKCSSDIKNDCPVPNVKDVRNCNFLFFTFLRNNKIYYLYLNMIVVL